MKTRLSLLVCLLLASVQTILAWSGDGTTDNPYLIATTADWQALAQQVADGESFSGKTFRMTADIDAQGTSVGTLAGTEERRFSGTFDGDGHTLTFNAGGSNGQGGITWSTELTAPFAYVSEATIRNLHTEGNIYTSHQYGAGIVGLVNGETATTLLNCSSSISINSSHSGNNDAAGGLVGAVNKGGLTMTNCTFDGQLSTNFNAGGMVGWSNVPITLEYCVVCPSRYFSVAAGENFARMAGGVNCTLTNCYYTQGIARSTQGTLIFEKVHVPDGCTAEILSEPSMTHDGVKYYTSGIKVRLSVPEGTQFDHWVGSADIATHVSDPWTANGVQMLYCSYQAPVLAISTQMPEAIQIEKSMGITYRYLSNRDYLLYLSEETCLQKNYQIDSDGYLFVYDSEGTKTYITAVEGCEPNDEDFQNTITSGWIWSNHQYEGTIVVNDIVADLREHTHLAVIAPHAFEGVTQLKKLVFQSNAKTKWRDPCSIAPDFHIGEQAFKGCTNLKELVMMYYDYKPATWNILGPTSGVTIADNALEGTNCRIVTDQSVYQAFLSDENWRAHQNHIGIYMATGEDISQDGVVYSYMRDNQGEPVKNNAAGHETLMNTLRTWNAEFQNFTASSLLAEQDKKNIWYNQIIGVDDSSLDNGKMIIRNDPGTYYNYKTIAIGRDAFAGNENLQYIEFEQVVGSRNSYSDLKMVIHNGAFKGCTNLKELRMFYHVIDNSDGSSSNPHWMSLGPQDIIPGNNIFGVDLLTEEQMAKIARGENIEDELQFHTIPKDFRILVAPERMAEFMQDPNWAPYRSYLCASDLTPTTEDEEFTISGSTGLTYGYITNLGGIRETSQTVSQDLSWWTLPRIAVEVGLYIATAGSWFAANKVVNSIGQTATNLTNAVAEKEFTNTMQSSVGGVLAEFGVDKAGNPIYSGMLAPANDFFSTTLAGKNVANISVLNEYLTPFYREQLTNLGWMDDAGNFVNTVTFFGPKVTDVNVYQGMLILRNILSNADMILSSSVTRLSSELAKQYMARIMTIATSMATSTAIVSQSLWGGSSHGEALKNGMRDNIRANMHQVGVHGGGYVFTTPTKNLVYHAFLKRVDDSVENAVVYAGTDKGQGKNASSVTATFARDAFRNHKNLKTVSFHENNISTNEGVAMLLAIPDSAFVGCDNLTEFSTILQSDNGQQALGPESFILAGDSIFVGRLSQAEVDSLTAIGQGDGLVAFHILIDESRKEDYLASETWAPLQRYFKYTNTLPKREHDEYGGWYAYAYENGSLQKVHKVQGHKIEHMVVSEADNDFLTGHQGALKLCNDIGSYNNYQLDAVRYKAFFNNPNLRVVNFTDLKGTTGFGDTYTDLDVTLEDSCFARCPNLANIDMLYLVTDGTNHIDPITPQQVKLGRGVLDGTTAKIKMLPQQVEWFEADTTWAKYRDRFLPCIIKPADDEVLDALEDMAYYDMAHTGYDDVYWTDYIDLARIGGAGFNWLDGKFSGKDIRSFNEFRHFESVGLDYVGSSWFSGCSKLSSIALPKTIKTIGASAFENCPLLTTISLPATVETIGGNAFNGCSTLTTVRVLGATPATLEGSNQFTKSEGLKIYVPDGAVAAYKQAWAEYKDYIVSDKTLKSRKVVTVTDKGQLAAELGLTPEKQSSKIRYLRGEYASIDSLTITGPLNGEDLSVIRHLAGADAYDSDPTDGCLRYLNLWNAVIKRDDENSYNGNGSDEYIKEDNQVPDYLFENCTAIQTVIFPKTATYIGENIFEDATSLRKVCVGLATTSYKCDILQNLSGIEELVLLTDGHATSEYDDPWEANIGVTYATNAQIGNYMGDINLTRRTSYVLAPFKDDAVMRTLADHAQFFPSDYLELETVEGLFNDNNTITNFEDFNNFTQVKDLDCTFNNASALKTIALPDSLLSIGAEAFAGCTSLDTIYVACDSVPVMAAGALDDLPSNFRIMVPKRLCKLYRTKWAEYADHINVDESLYSYSDIITVTLTEPNTLAEKLGLSTTMGGSIATKCINSVSGDYSRVHKLKVVGPISGADFDVIRHLAGWCTCIHKHNMAGHLEYLDLYEAQIKKTDIGYVGENSALFGHSGHVYTVSEDDVLPYQALMKSYNLKTLILPKTCKEVERRALQECEGLEVIVIGDDTEEFNWNALDDDASLTRMYFLAKKKVEIDTQFAIWRWLCNNYNPTFDAFYVRPSQLNDYRNDPDYTGSSWQRTNNIQSGIFTTDDQFLPFAAHAAVTFDDLATVTDVNGWFSSHKDLKDLTALGFTSINSLRVSDMQELTKLEKIDLPMTFQGFYDDPAQTDSLGNVIPDGLDHRPFTYATELSYVNMLACDSTLVIDELRGDIKEKLGVNADALVYVPTSYGTTDEHNVVWGDAGNLQNNYFDLNDAKDYSVPLTFTSRHISSSRVLKPRKADDGTTNAETSKYTVSLPYSMNVPTGAKAFRLEGREGSKLIFTEQQNRMEANTPYLLVLTNDEVSLASDIEQELPSVADAEAAIGRNQKDVPGYSMRGTVKAIDNATAAEQGAYILQSDNKWHKVPTGVAEANIPAFRTYLLTNGGTGVKAFTMELQEAGADGIDTIQTIEADGTERYYDLSGREIVNGKLPRGVYIHNGKKYINK